MKVNVLPIARDHFATLRDARTGRLSLIDIFIFYAVPILAGAAAYCLGVCLSKDASSASITFFGIFIALLLNIQMAMFSIFQRKWTFSKDEIVAEYQKNTEKERRVLLLQINANTSYLIVFCCFCLVFFLILYVKNMEARIVAAIGVFIYAHFILTLLMIVKRSHALFHKEYRDSP